MLATQLTYVESELYGPVIVLIKTSILLQCITIFVVHRRGTFYWTVHVLIWTNIVYYIVCGIVSIFQVG